MTATDDTKHATGTLPRIWYTRIMTDIDAGVEVDTVFSQPSLKDTVRFGKHYEAWEIDPGGNEPRFLKFRNGETKIKPTLLDAFRQFALTISPILRDVLVQFDLGSTRLFEVPIYEEDGETLSSFSPYYVLHVTETKPTLIPEASKNIERPNLLNLPEVDLKTRWMYTLHPDELAVKATSGTGVDLWADKVLFGRLFFSDRLKRAIDAADIQSTALTFVQARTLP